MGSWVIQVIELKFDVSIDLWDHLEAAVASVATKIAITWIYQELLVPLRVQIKFQNHSLCPCRHICSATTCGIVLNN